MAIKNTWGEKSNIVICARAKGFRKFPAFFFFGIGFGVSSPKPQLPLPKSHPASKPRHPGRYDQKNSQQARHAITPLPHMVRAIPRPQRRRAFFAQQGVGRQFSLGVDLRNFSPVFPNFQILQVTGLRNRTGLRNPRSKQAIFGS